ncbi:MAG: hypothetical protein ABW090_15730 [Sedimenticola sp.]
MLNHLAIDPLDFPRSSSLVGIIESWESGADDIGSSLVRLSQTVFPSRGGGGGLSRLRGLQLEQYRETFRRIEARTDNVYLLTREVPGSHRETFDVDVLRGALKSLFANLNPTWIAFTFEGQPEAQIFRQVLKEDPVFHWVLSESKAIVSLVRFDAANRFQDGVGIPIEIAKHPEWRKRLLLLLTRCSNAPTLTEEVRPYYLGRLPFAGFIGESVNSGRIPIVDMMSVPFEEQTQEHREYRIRLAEASRELLERLATKEEN